MKLNIDNSDFRYIATLRLTELPDCQTKESFPGVADVGFKSRDFSNYADCSTSVKNFMADMVKSLNDQFTSDHQYMLTTEVNPTYSGVSTKSKDWADGELARLWLFESEQEDDTVIHAIGQARVYMLDREDGPVLH